MPEQTFKPVHLYQRPVHPSLGHFTLNICCGKTFRFPNLSQDLFLFGEGTRTYWIGMVDTFFFFFFSEPFCTRLLYISLERTHTHGLEKLVCPFSRRYVFRSRRFRDSVNLTSKNGTRKLDVSQTVLMVSLSLLQRFYKKVPDFLKTFVRK